ncbi:MAG: recombinase TnpX [Clostridiales bacterium 52_15]|nr:MAG: recombinase TnpX [Clostridiales bacterium 52_15]
MARKSRKVTAAEPIMEAAPAQRFPTAIYARLSVENSGKSEKVDIIANQIEICKSYLTERPYLDLVDTYVDNGRTGTVFDRPEFNRLMTDIRSGRIKCLVVRDLSRFGRDYIETGTFLERIFPQIGLRFISIKENFDSFDTDGNSESLLIPLQNMVNSLYSKDISRKVSTALKAQMESGEFKKRNLPYGYRWDEEHSNMVFDEETAPIVRKIFQWKIEGLSLPTIADRLDAMDAPNPEFQKYQVGVRTGNATEKKVWNKSTLTSILDNPHYVGDTVLGRTLNAIYKGVKNQHIDRENWIVFPDTHEAIISREDFQKVREMREAAARARVEKMERSEKIRATLINLFDGKIVCAECGKKLYYHRKRIDKDKRGRWYAFYECSTSVGRRYEHCTPHYTRQDVLEEKVLASIQLQVKAALDYDKLLDKLRGSEGEKNIRDQQNALITSLNLRISGVSKKRTRLYEDYVEGVLDEEEYVFAKKSYDEQFAELSRRLDEAVQRRSKFNEAMSVDNKWITLMKSVSTATRLSQELVDESIELVKVHEDGVVELVMKYSDLYALTIQSIKEVQEAM